MDIRNWHGGIIVLGADLTSRGGIASVIQAYQKAHTEGNYVFKMFLLRTNYYMSKPSLYELIMFPKSVLQYISLIRTEDIRLVHIHSSAHLSFYRKSVFFILAKLFKKKIILHLHSSDFYNFFLNGSWYVRKILATSDCVVVLCSDWKNKLRQSYPNLLIRKIENPYCGLIHEDKKFLVASDIANIVFLGFLVESKGIRDLMLLSDRLVETNVKNFKLQIAGDGDMRDFVINTIREKRMSDIVEYVGWVDGDKKITLLEKADIFILPSYKEGMPIAILEAMAYGLPVLSTKISGIPDIVVDGENGYLSDPGDIDALYSNLRRLLDNRSEIKVIGKRNMERVRENSYDKIFAQVCSTYVDVLHIKE